MSDPRTPTDFGEWDPLLHLLGGMGEKRPGEYIERLERIGGNQMATSDVLPTAGLSALPSEWGIVIGEAQDDLFTAVTLPAGWRKVTTEHSMWTRLLDNDSRERARIFYKAAFYDRRADIHAVRYDPATQAYCANPDCGRVSDTVDSEFSEAAEWWCAGESRCYVCCTDAAAHGVYPHFVSTRR
jgi:hypothetical protein